MLIKSILIHNILHSVLTYKNWLHISVNLFRRQNPAGYVISQVRDHAHPELLTQAWCKMTECLTKFKLVEDFLDEKGKH